MLIFVGAKMLLTDVYKVPVGISLAVIALVLLLSAVLSLVFPKNVEAHSPVEGDPLAPHNSIASLETAEKKPS